jgi:heme exporter protein A
MLEALELEATRGDAVLFRGIGFALAPGALLRVTGANGSGKTSLLRVLCGLLAPSAGSVRWNRRDIRALSADYRGNFSYVGHANALKSDLTVAENLAVACALAGLAATPARLAGALERLGLASRRHLPAKALSQGQRRRAALARLALSEALPLWILDEPFAALDVEAIDTVQSLVGEHLARGGMAVLTTHQEARIKAPSVTDIDLGPNATAGESRSNDLR